MHAWQALGTLWNCCQIKSDDISFFIPLKSKYLLVLVSQLQAYRRLGITNFFLCYQSCLAPFWVSGAIWLLPVNHLSATSWDRLKPPSIIRLWAFWYSSIPSCGLTSPPTKSPKRSRANPTTLLPNLGQRFHTVWRDVEAWNSLKNGECVKSNYNSAIPVDNN